MIYADYNGSTPCLPEVADLMCELLCETYGNPSNKASLFSRRARGYIDQARSQVATAIGANEDELIFSSGSTEACNQAILGVMQRSLKRRPRILLSAVEHPAVCQPAEACAEAGADLHYVDVDSQGRLDLDQLKDLLREPTALVCVMAANNETGVIQDLKPVVDLAQQAGALVFSDMTQMLGKRAFDVHMEGVDFACFSAHKCYGPKGVGALYKRRGLALPALIRGGGQENGLRSGTENVPGIAAFGLAADLAAREVQSRSARLSRFSQQLERQLKSRLPGCIVQGEGAERLGGTSMLSLPGIRGNWISHLGDLVVSGGSSCASLQEKPSHVLMAMGNDEEVAKRSVRISLGRPSTEVELRQIIQRLIEAAQRIL